jgi:hypothetical protein
MLERLTHKAPSAPPAIKLTLSEPDKGYQLTLFAPNDVPPLVPSIDDVSRWLCDRWCRKLSGGLDIYPYSRAFEHDYNDFSRLFGAAFAVLRQHTGGLSNKNALWQMLLMLRKNGKLATLGRIRRHDDVPLKISKPEIRVIRDSVGLPKRRSERERLPYTSEFCQLLQRFHTTCDIRGIPSDLSDYSFWRAIVRIMKSDRVRLEGPTLWSL